MSRPQDAHPSAPTPRDGADWRARRRATGALRTPGEPPADPERDPELERWLAALNPDEPVPGLGAPPLPPPPEPAQGPGAPGGPGGPAGELWSPPPGPGPARPPEPANGHGNGNGHANGHGNGHGRAPGGEDAFEGPIPLPWQPAPRRRPRPGPSALPSPPARPPARPNGRPPMARPDPRFDAPHTASAPATPWEPPRRATPPPVAEPPGLRRRAPAPPPPRQPTQDPDTPPASEWMGQAGGRAPAPGGAAHVAPPARRSARPKPDAEGLSPDTMGRPTVLWPPQPRRRRAEPDPEDTTPPDFDVAPPPVRRQGPYQPRPALRPSRRQALAPPPPSAPAETEAAPGTRRAPPRAPRGPARDQVARRAARHKGLAARRAASAGARRAGFLRELPFLLIIAVVLAILVKGMIVQAFYIPSESMLPTLHKNDRVLVNRLAYRFGRPKHGQVIVFYRPDPEAGPQPTGFVGFLKRAAAQGLGYAPPGTEDLIKRVIGEPGDVLFARNGKVWRNGKPLDEPYVKPGARTTAFGPIRVPEGHVWVMGDNREDSQDSRKFGPVPESTLVGRAVVLIWPFGNVSGL